MNTTFDLTRLEREVLLMLVQGFDAADIATQLHISRNYVYTIVTKLRCRFNVKTSAGVAAYALSHNLVSLIPSGEPTNQ